MNRHIVGPVDEIRPGSVKRVIAEGRPIAVFNVKGEFFAIIDRCPHEGASLCKGQIIGLAVSDEPGQFQIIRQGEMIRCPWHGWEFDIRTGRSWCDPSRTRVKSYDVSVESGQALVEGPYAAETVNVSVDDDYVVLEL